MATVVAQIDWESNETKKPLAKERYDERQRFGEDLHDWYETTRDLRLFTAFARLAEVVDRLSLVVGNHDPDGVVGELEAVRSSVLKLHSEPVWCKESMDGVFRVVEGLLTEVISRLNGQGGTDADGRPVAAPALNGGAGNGRTTVIKEGAQSMGVIATIATVLDSQGELVARVELREDFSGRLVVEDAQWKRELEPLGEGAIDLGLDKVIRITRERGCERERVELSGEINNLCRGELRLVLDEQGIEKVRQVEMEFHMRPDVPRRPLSELVEELRLGKD